MIHSDQTGDFPTVSYTSKKCMIVIYNYDSNSILIETMHDHTGPELKHAYIKLVDHLKAAGLNVDVSIVHAQCTQDTHHAHHAWDAHASQPC